MVGPAGDTELFKPSLADGKSVAEAKIVFMNDLNDEFEPWLEPLLKRVKFGGTKIVVSRGAKTYSSSEERAPRGKAVEEIDQHAWLDPKNGVIYVKNIAAALAKNDPANAADYRVRAAAYIKELQDLDAWAKAEMAAVPPAKRRILSSHDSLQYLAKAYGITMLSINGWTNNSEPSAAELASLTQKIRQEGIRALFLDSITDPRAMQQVAKETGAAIGGTLYGDALSEAGRRSRHLPQDASSRRGDADSRHDEKLTKWMLPDMSPLGGPLLASARSRLTIAGAAVLLLWIAVLWASLSEPTRKAAAPDCDSGGACPAPRRRVRTGRTGWR